MESKKRLKNEKLRKEKIKNNEKQKKEYKGKDKGNIRRLHERIKKSYNNIEIKSLRSETYRDMELREYFSIVLGITASFLGIVFAIAIFLMLIIYFPYAPWYYTILLPFIWVVVSIANVFIIERYVRCTTIKNNKKECNIKKEIKKLFYSSLINTMTANGFLIPGFLMLISWYSLLEINERKQRKLKIKEIK